MAVAAKAEAGEKVTTRAAAGMVRQSKLIKAKRERAYAEPPGAVSPVAPNSPAKSASSSDEMVEQAFALLKAKLEPPRLARIAYLLGRCDLGSLIGRIGRHLSLG